MSELIKTNYCKTKSLSELRQGFISNTKHSKHTLKFSNKAFIANSSEHNNSKGTSSSFNKFAYITGTVAALGQVLAGACLMMAARPN